MGNPGECQLPGVSFSMDEVKFIVYYDYTTALSAYASGNFFIPPEIFCCHLGKNIVE